MGNSPAFRFACGCFFLDVVSEASRLWYSLCDHLHLPASHEQLHLHATREDVHFEVAQDTVQPSPTWAAQSISMSSPRLCATSFPEKLETFAIDMYGATATQFTKLTAACFPPKKPAKLPFYAPSHFWPTFLKPMAIDEMIRIELVHQFCKYTSLVVYQADILEIWLGRDLFKTGVSLSQTRLPSLAIVISLSHKDMSATSSNAMLKEIELLLRWNQNLTKHFALTVRIHTDCDKPATRVATAAQAWQAAQRLGNISPILRMLHRSMHELVHLVTSGKPDRKAAVELEFRCQNNTSLIVPYNEAMLDWGRRTWVDQLRLLQ